jgi:CHAT domain-containing protein
MINERPAGPSTCGGEEINRSRRQFYRGREERQLTKAEALRQGQLGLIQDGRSGYSHPFFWAPFILMGNWL